MLKYKIAKGSCRAFLVLALAASATASMLAASGVVGSVAGSMNASLGGQSLLPNTTIFSGDNLQVKDGVAVIAVGANNRMIFGRNTAVIFVRETNQVTVSLGQGNLTLLHPVDGTPVCVKAAEISITPAPGLKTVGDIALVSDSLVITAKEGTLQVVDHGTSQNVVKGQTIVIAPNAAKGAIGAGGAAPSSSALAGATGTTALAATSAAATGSVAAATAAVGSAKLSRPGSTRPLLTPLNLAGLAASAAVTTNTNANCAPPTPSRNPTASTVVPFSATPGPVCPLTVP